MFKIKKRLLKSFKTLIKISFDQKYLQNVFFCCSVLFIFSETKFLKLLLYKWLLITTYTKKSKHKFSFNIYCTVLMLSYFRIVLFSLLGKNFYSSSYDLYTTTLNKINWKQQSFWWFKLFCGILPGYFLFKFI